jgi:hypothetical protein
MTALDVRALVLNLRLKLIGLRYPIQNNNFTLIIRLANVYDLSGKQYLLKFAKANRKEVLLIESGIRVHST